MLAVIGHSHNELGRFTVHDPVHHGHDQSQLTVQIKLDISDRRTHIGSALDNCVTLTFDPYLRATASISQDYWGDIKEAGSGAEPR